MTQRAAQAAPTHIRVFLIKPGALTGAQLDHLSRNILHADGNIDEQFPKNIFFAVPPDDLAARLQAAQKFCEHIQFVNILPSDGHDAVGSAID